MNTVVLTASNPDLISALQQRMQTSHISSTALVFTFFCDVVTQHGGEVWLGSVIQALAPLNITERSVRTAVFRLVKDDWLTARKQGRLSYYRLSETGQHYYQRAAQRIYSIDKPDWDGSWMLLFVAMVPEEKREALHRGLSWLGYGRLATAVYALPGHDQAPVNELLSDLGIGDNIVHMQAKADNSSSLKELVLSRWQLQELQERYLEYTHWLKQLQLTLKPHPNHNTQALLLLRVLLIHEYRRILLTDPELPAVMLPVDWPGETAKSQTAITYRKLYADTANWFSNQLSSAHDKISMPSDTSEIRFTSLKGKK